MSASACTRSMPGYHCHKQLMCSADDDAVRDLEWKSVLAHVSSQEEEMSGCCVETASENPRITHVHSLAIPASRKLSRLHDDVVDVLLVALYGSVYDLFSTFTFWRSLSE